MFLISEDRTTIVNMDNVNAVYSGENGQLRVEMRDGRVSSYRLATYISKEQADAAIGEIMYRMEHNPGTIIQCPSMDDMDAIMRMRFSRERASNGKKTVRRGNS